MKKAFVLLCSVSVLGGCARSPEARCGRGDGPACFNLGISYAEGEGVAQSWERANPLYEKACALGVAGACTNLGASYARGNGVAQSWERANALYEKACGLGDSFGCANLGKDYAKGRGVAQSWERANALFEKACALGDQDSCQAAKDAKVAREDQDKLPANRAELLDKAADRESGWWAGTWECSGLAGGAKFELAAPLVKMRWSHHAPANAAFGAREYNDRDNSTITAIYSGTEVLKDIDNSLGEGRVDATKSVQYLDVKTDAGDGRFKSFRLVRDGSYHADLLNFRETPKFFRDQAAVDTLSCRRQQY